MVSALIAMNVCAMDRWVTNTNDAGLGSLRTEIADAAQGDTVRFATLMNARTITLTSGAIILDKNLTIDGADLSKGVTVSGGGTSRVFEISYGASAVLNSLSLRNGKAPDGSLDTEGNGRKGGDGGAIHNAGTLSIVACALFNNVAGQGGGIGLAHAGGGGSGGAIYNRGTLSLTNCTLTGNAAGPPGLGTTGFEGFGAAIYNAGTASLSACTIAGNDAAGGSPQLGGFTLRQGKEAVSLTVGEASPLAQLMAPPPPVVTAVFVSPSGNDANPGSRVAPLLTASAAMTAIGGKGEIILLAGDYQNLRFNLATASRLTIRADRDAVVRVFLGEKVSVFTPDSGIVWKATVAAGYNFTETDNRLWVFEWGTPEGPIAAAAAHPLQRGRTHRLSHARLRLQANKAAVGAGSARYWYDANEHALYLSATDGGNPNGRDYWIPSQASLQSLVFGGTSAAEVIVEGIEVFFGRENLDFSYCRSYVARSCLLYGASNEGIAANPLGRGFEEDNEYAANANDGSGPGKYSLPWASLVVIDPWAHDNGDEGHSIHRNIEAIYYGGLFEYNTSGGITPAQGAKFTAVGPFTRGNLVGIYPAVTILNAAVNIVAISTTNPAVLTTAAPHGVQDGEVVRIANATGGSPDINGDRVATVIGPNTFSVGLAQSGAPTGGTIARLTGTHGTVCDWVSHADSVGCYISTTNGVVKLIDPTLISPVLRAFQTSFGATIEAYDPAFISVQNVSGGAGTMSIINGVPIPRPASECGALFTGGRVEIGNSIVAANVTGNISSWGSLIDLGSNLATGDPVLGPFDDYGGPTPTMALLPDSPARDAALNAVTPADQRGFPRSVGAADIGAYEAGHEAGFRAWAWEHLPASSNHFFSDDYDRDGYSEGIEYALQSDPLTPNGGLTFQRMASVPGQDAHTLTFPYRPGASDLKYVVERSNDLGITEGWQEILRFELSTGLVIGISGVTAHRDPVQSSATIFDTNAVSPQAFWRLRVQWDVPLE